MPEQVWHNDGDTTPPRLDRSLVVFADTEVEYLIGGEASNAFGLPGQFFK